MGIELEDALEYRDGSLYWKIKVRSDIPAGTRAGTINPGGYRVIIFKKKNYLEHRLIWYLIYGTWPDKDIDHINRVKDDNRIENLRLITESDNSRNSARCERELPTGVYLNSQGNPHAKIEKNGERYYLGTFKTVQEAKEAFDNKFKEIDNAIRIG